MEAGFPARAFFSQTFFLNAGIAVNTCTHFSAAYLITGVTGQWRTAMSAIWKSVLKIGIAAALSVISAASVAQSAAPVSKCLAMVDAGPELSPRVMFAKIDAAPMPLVRVQAKAPQVVLTYIDHAVWQITSPEGIIAATDYYGLPLNPPPSIATMNNAHRTHWTPNPDPAIKHVLAGWSTDGINEAQHAVVEGDMLVRNVATDTRLGGEMRRNGNSIFIFETGDLCIGHLGHLHHALDDRHYAQIGRLDVIMVPVDGGLTLSHAGMSELVKRLRPSVLLPMHLRGNSVQSFITMLGSGFDTEYLSTDTLTISLNSLPKTPTVFVPASLN
jgi:Beta-lactamase superfamily domain